VTSSARVLVLSGRGRYEDPWHDMAATSHRVADVLRGSVDGVGEVVVRGSFPDALEDIDAFDLLVVNCASGRPDPGFDGDDSRWVPFHEALRRWADAGRPVLALHQAANTFGDSPHWERVLGGRWVDGTSMHPPIDEATFEVVDPGHPAVAGAQVDGRARVVVFDERYSFLRVSRDVRVLVTQRHDGADHPVVWVRDGATARVVYDALGHDVRSYDSPSRRALLVSEVGWLLAG